MDSAFPSVQYVSPVNVTVRSLGLRDCKITVVFLQLHLDTGTEVLYLVSQQSWHSSVKRHVDGSGNLSRNKVSVIPHIMSVQGACFALLERSGTRKGQMELIEWIRASLGLNYLVLQSYSITLLLVRGEFV